MKVMVVNYLFLKNHKHIDFLLGILWLLSSFVLFIISILIALSNVQLAIRLNIISWVALAIFFYYLIYRIKKGKGDLPQSEVKENVKSIEKTLVINTRFFNGLDHSIIR